VAAVAVLTPGHVIHPLGMTLAVNADIIIFGFILVAVRAFNMFQLSGMGDIINIGMAVNALKVAVYGHLKDVVVNKGNAFTVAGKAVFVLKGLDRRYNTRYGHCEKEEQ
jgi:hypothetical protein